MDNQNTYTQYLYINRRNTVKVVGEVAEDKKIVKKVFINGKLCEFDADNIPDDLGKFAVRESRNMYRSFLSKQFKNILVFTGAGSSIGIGNKQKGMSVYGLWQVVESTIGKDTLDEIILDIGYDGDNLEAFLSRVSSMVNLIGNKLKKKYTIKTDDKEEKVDLKDILKIILNIIKMKCSIDPPENRENFPHIAFLEKVLKRKPTLSRVKVFTANYDTLFEYAANALGAVVIDGFSFSSPRTFSGRYFDYDIVQREKSRLKDEDNFVPRVFHLYKLHGSVNWTRVNSEIIMSEDCNDPLMVYPRESKYESSYEQPFFEMMARFQQCLRQDNTLLITIGFSFNDKHIVAAITEAINQNPGFQLLVVNPNFDDGGNERFTSLRELALKTESVIMIDDSFSDFANQFPELKTYEEDTITLNKFELESLLK